MHNRLFVLLFFTNLLGLKAQIEKQKPRVSKLDFSYSFGYQHVRMQDINKYYLDSFAIPAGLFTKNVHHTFYRNLQFNYQFNRFFGLGFMMKSDLASLSHTSPGYLTDEVGNILDTFQFDNALIFRNRTIGLQANFDVTHLLESKGKIRPDTWRLNLISGASVNFMNVILHSSSPFYQHDYEYYAPRIGGFAQVKVSYPIIRFKTSHVRLGFNLGYQYAKSTVLMSSMSNWIVMGEHPMTADFSGFNAGIGLTLEVPNRPYNKQNPSPSRNAIYLDVLGQSLYGGLIYERTLNIESTRTQRSLAGGILFLNRNPWDYIRVVSVPISYNTTFDFNRTKNLPHKLELGLGITALAIKGFESGSTTDDQFLFPSVRLGYCYHSYHNGLLFKATLTPALAGLTREIIGDERFTYFGSAAFFDRVVMPWIGISIGKTF